MFFLWIVHDSSSHVPNWYTREQGDSNLQPTCHTFLVLSAHKPHLAPSSYMIVAPYDRCLFSSNRALLVVFPCYHDASISRHLCWGSPYTAWNFFSSRPARAKKCDKTTKPRSNMRHLPNFWRIGPIHPQWSLMILYHQKVLSDFLMQLLSGWSW